MELIAGEEFAMAAGVARAYVQPMRIAPPVLALVIAACGGGSAKRDAPPPLPPPVSGDVGAGVEEPAAAGPPDAGTRAGHGGDLDALFSQPARSVIRVPETDRTPPLALIRLDAGAARPVVHDSPVRRKRSAVVRLVRPELAATALIRDADGGTGRIRVSLVYVTRCQGTDRQRAQYFPPPQIESIKIAPGVRTPIQLTRSARVRFPAGCRVSGKVFAEATNASGLESFSDPIWFVF
jgi:hypothetical protein